MGRLTSRLEEFTFTVPHGTEESKPVKQAIVFDPGTVIRYELRIPYGTSAFAGIRIAAFGTQIVPNNAGAFIVGDDEKITDEPSGWPNSGKLEFQGYNEGKFDHTFRLRLFIVENEEPSEATGEAAPSEVPSTGASAAPSEGAPEAAPIAGEAPAPAPPEGGEAPPVTAEAPAPAPEGGEAPPPTVPGEGAEAPPTPVEAGVAEEAPPSTEATPEGEPVTPEGMRAPASATSSHPKAHYRTERVKVQHAPKTGLKEALEYVSGHPELHKGVSVATNLILRAFPRLVITSTTGGKHAPGSLHYKGEAVDFANPDAGYMNEASAWIKHHLQRYLTEGIHDPDLSVKAGAAVAASFWGGPTWSEHLGHIHVGVAPPQEAELLRDNKPTIGYKTKRVLVHPAKRKPAAHHKPKGKKLRRASQRQHRGGSTKLRRAAAGPKHKPQKRRVPASQHHRAPAPRRRAVQPHHAKRR